MCVQAKSFKNMLSPPKRVFLLHRVALQSFGIGVGRNERDVFRRTATRL
jgi:hypothetical protein